MPCRIHPCLSYLDFREGNCLSHQKSGKTWNFMYKTYGELSTTFHHFEYRPLEIARFQRAVTSLFFAWFCSNFHWLFSIINTLFKNKLDMWVLVSFNDYHKCMHNHLSLNPKRAGGGAESAPPPLDVFFCATSFHDFFLSSLAQLLALFSEKSGGRFQSYATLCNRPSAQNLKIFWICVQNIWKMASCAKTPFCALKCSICFHYS